MVLFDGVSWDLSFLIFEAVIFLFMGFFMWAGAEIAEIRGNNFYKAFVIAFFGTIITFIMSVLFRNFGFYSAILSVIVSSVANMAIIKLIYRTGWRKATITWVFAIIAQIAALFVLAFVLSVFNL